MKSSMGIATSVSYLDVPREPSSSETRAIVPSSGASTMLMKSNWPSVAHCALTLAPSCSTSWLTSRMRCGLFLTVCTPSGVKEDNMMYVGMTAFPRVLRVLANLLVGWALLLAVPCLAHAATIQTDLPCYLEQRQVQVTGTGFQPGASYTVLRDGQAIGSGTVTGDGAVAGSFPSGSLETGVAERAFDLTVTDGTNQAATRFRVSRFRAEFAPSRGNPATLRVRFSVFGFGRAALPVYVHYLRPDGLSVQTVRLGMTQGACGSIPRTRTRRLFPFRPGAGRWRLQFDTRKTYRKTAVPRIVRAVDVRRGRRR